MTPERKERARDLLAELLIKDARPVSLEFGDLMAEMLAEIARLERQLLTEWGDAYDTGKADGIAEASKGRAAK